MGAAILPVRTAVFVLVLTGILQPGRPSVSASAVAVPTRTVESAGRPDSGPGQQANRRVVRRVYRVTAYNDRGLTASGVWSGVGQCAAPADIPFGARVHIPALGRTLVVTDRTHRRFRSNTVDIYMPGYEQCRSFGRRYLECVVEFPPEPFEYGSPELKKLVRQVGSSL